MHVHSDLNHADELHQVGHRLAQPIARANDPAPWGGADTLSESEVAVTVLVDTAAPVEKSNRATARLGDREGAERTAADARKAATLAYHVDPNGGYPMRSHLCGT